MQEQSLSGTPQLRPVQIRAQVVDELEPDFGVLRVMTASAAATVMSASVATG
jgi:hypothetical protein